MEGFQMQPVFGQVQGPPPATALDYLATLDEIRINQKIDVAEVVTGIDMRNRYSVENATGQQVLFCSEESGICQRVCCKEHRGFVVHVADVTGLEVLTLTREFKCCILPCCADPTGRYALEVTAQGQKIGTIRQSQQCCPFPPKLTVESSTGQELYHMEGPTCVCHGPCCYADVPFHVYSAGGSSPVATVSRTHAGFVQECLTKANNFKIVFSQGVDKNSKVLLFAATFLIDMMFFEHDK